MFGSMAIRAQEEGATIKVAITNIASGKGQILIALYDTEDSWLKKLYKGAIGKIVNGESSSIFTNIPAGTYAVSVFHDEDNDGELDTNFLGIPKEDTGSSNNAPANFGPPKWEDAKFEVKGNTVVQTIKL